MIRPNMMALLALMGAMEGMPNNPRKGPLDDIDLESEYELIMQKKSKLSANLRRQVIAKIKARKES